MTVTATGTGLGPVTREQMTRLASTWKQGEHVLISGGTGSGKTALARHIDQVRVDRGGHVVVFVCKLTPDETILDDYKGWTRWKRWRKNPGPNENKILLWPEVEKIKGVNAGNRKMDLQRAVFQEAMDELIVQGKWTVHIDEGLYFVDPQFMNLGKDLARMHYMGRTSKLTCITLTQRPAHLPLVIYSSASHAFIGRNREQADLKRLSELGGRESAKGLSSRIDLQGRHDFLWVPVAPDWEPETVNIRR